MSPRLRYILQETFIGLRRNLLMTIAVFLSIAVSLTLVGTFVLLRNQVDKMAGEWTGKIEVSIFLCDGTEFPAITPDQQESLRSSLEQEPVVREVFYESKQEAYDKFVEQFENQPDLLAEVTPASLPASFRVKLEDPERFTVIKEKYAAQPGIEDIVDSRDTLENLLRLADVVRFGALAIAALAVFASGVLIVNIIRVAAYARREQTAIMKLVGASNWYIRLPFLLEGIVAGLAGALVAWGLLLVATPFVADLIRENLSFLVAVIGIEEAIAVGGWLIAAGIGMSAASSMIALWGFLDV